MSAAHASAAARSSPPALHWRHLAASAAWTALALFVLLALLLAVRRLTGALTQPIAGPILVPLAAGIAAASVLLRLWLLPLRLDVPWQRSAPFWLLVAVPSAAVALFLAAVMTPGTNWLAAFVALLFAAAIEGLFWRHLAVALRPREVRASPQLPPAETAAEATVDEIVEEESYPANLLQQIVRTRQASGEAIHAVLRAEFQPGEQTHVLHVAFCPPLADAPRLEAFVTGEMDADVKITAAYGFGARLEVQLSQPAQQPRSVMVELAGESGRTG